MTPLTERYLTQADLFTAVVDAATDWTAPSPCEEWTATDVVEHVVSTQRGYFDQRGAHLGDLPGDDPSTRWHTHLRQVRDVVADDGFATTEFDGYFGRTTVDELLANFYGFDMTVHRWDLGQAVGVPVTFTDDELDRIEQPSTASARCSTPAGRASRRWRCRTTPHASSACSDASGGAERSRPGQPTRTGCRTTASNR